MPAKKKKEASRLQKLSAIGAALTAAGLFLMQMFISPDDIFASPFYRTLQILLSLLGAVSAACLAVKKGVPLWHNIFSAGAAITVVGVLLLGIMAPENEMRGWNYKHVIQLTLVGIGAVSVVGLSVFQIKAAKNGRTKEIEDKNLDIQHKT